MIPFRGSSQGCWTGNRLCRVSKEKTIIKGQLGKERRLACKNRGHSKREGKVHADGLAGGDLHRQAGWTSKNMTRSMTSLIERSRGLIKKEREADNAPLDIGIKQRRE